MLQWRACPAKRKKEGKKGKKERKIRAEINEIEILKKIGKINETKIRFFEKINKIDKPLARLIKKKREQAQIHEIRNKYGEITTNITEIQRIIRLLLTTIHQWSGQLRRTGQILRKYNLPGLSQEEI